MGNGSKSITISLKTETDHAFDFAVAESPLLALQRPNDNGNNNALVVRYGSHHPRKLSLWNSMLDELRVLPTTTATTTLSDAPGAAITGKSGSSSASYDILLGLGSMSWSGGVLNASPFCLYRLKQKPTRTTTLSSYR